MELIDSEMWAVQVRAYPDSILANRKQLIEVYNRTQPESIKAYFIGENLTKTYKSHGKRWDNFFNREDGFFYILPPSFDTAKRRCSVGYRYGVLPSEYVSLSTVPAAEYVRFLPLELQEQAKNDS